MTALWDEQNVSCRLKNVVCIYLSWGGWNGSDPPIERTIDKVLAIDAEALGKEYNCGKKTKMEFIAWKAGLGLDDYENLEKQKTIVSIDDELSRLAYRVKSLKEQRRNVKNGLKKYKAKGRGYKSDRLLARQ